MQKHTRLAILESDTALTKTRAKYGGYGGVFEALLAAGATASGIPDLSSQLKVTKHQIVDDPDSYPKLEEIDAILITGSRYDAFADTPWINKLVDYTAKALATRRIRTVGVCFGHQIIGRALGVKVGRNNAWEAAVEEVKMTKKGKELFEGLDKLQLHQMHRDIVFEYPSHVEQLGYSPVCQVQGMYVRDHLFTVQGHPEFNEEIMREILDTRLEMGIFDKETYNRYISRVALPHDGVVVAKAFLNFLLA